MAMYAIKDTTLTALGDAIRLKKDGLKVAPYVHKFQALVYKSGTGTENLTLTTDEIDDLNGIGVTQWIKVRVNSITNWQENGWRILHSSNSGMGVEIPYGTTFPIEFYCRYSWVSFYGYHTPSKDNPNLPLPVLDVEIWGCNKDKEPYFYTPLEMADKINEFSVVPEEAFNISGDCRYRFAYGGNDWLLSQYGDKLSFNDIINAMYIFTYSKAELGDLELNINNKVDCSYMYYYSTTKKAPKINGTLGNINYMFGECRELIEIPYDIYCDNSTYYGMGSVFAGCYKLETLPYIYNAYPSAIDELFYNCQMIREIPEDYMDTWNFSRIQSYTYAYLDSVFGHCYSLRKVPFKVLQKLRNDKTTSAYNKFYYQAFNMCYALDELVNLPVDKAKLTSNAFSTFVDRTHRLSNLMFETNEDGTPIVAPWKSQTIDLTQWVGYGMSSFIDTHDIIRYNSGITGDKRVYDDATYQALKDDPDWWSVDINYSRYNHDSAVNTINSLPDCSATGTNIIKFKGASGALTDGGAINTLTEEEIAVATAKGWTVSLV